MNNNIKNSEILCYRIIRIVSDIRNFLKIKNYPYPYPLCFFEYGADMDTDTNTDTDSFDFEYG